jgi:hypothetical protein
MQAVIDRRRDNRRERLVEEAARLVEPAQELFGKARGKGRPRLVEQGANGFEAEPPQRGADVRRKPQRFDRHVGERRSFIARRQDKQMRVMKVRQRPGRAGCCGNRKPGRQAEIFQPRGEIGDQFVLAAEQMRRAFDVEEEAVGAVLFVPRRSGRRIARRP